MGDLGHEPTAGAAWAAPKFIACQAREVALYCAMQVGVDGAMRERWARLPLEVRRRLAHLVLRPADPAAKSQPEAPPHRRVVPPQLPALPTASSV